jgi:hypothetical protein
VPGGEEVHFQRPSTAAAQGFDRRSRFDILITGQHVQVSENGHMLCDYVLKVPIGMRNVRNYGIHYVYHLLLQNGATGMPKWQPEEKYLLERVPWSDERHWGCITVQSLP